MPKLDLDPSEDLGSIASLAQAKIKNPEPAKEEKPPEKAPEKPEAKAPEKSEKPPEKSEEDPFFSDEKKPVKTPEAPQDFSEEEKGMTAKARAAFAKSRKEIAALKEASEGYDSKLKAAEEKIRELEGRDTAPIDSIKKENEELKAQIEEYEQSLLVSRIENSRTFKEQVTKPMKSLEGEAAEIAKRYEASEKDLLKILRDPQGKQELKSYASEFDEADRDDLYALKRDFDRLVKKENELREEAKGKGEQMFREEQEQQERLTGEQLKSYQASAKKAWDEARKTLTFLQKRDSTPDWNAALDQAEAESLKQIADPVASGEVRARAAQLPFVLRALEAQQKRAKTLVEERDGLLERIADYEKLEPGAGGRSDGNGGEADESDDLDVGSMVSKVAARR